MQSATERAAIAGAKEDVDTKVGGQDAQPYDDIVTAVNHLIDRTRAFLPEMQDLQNAVRGSSGYATAIGEVGELVRLLTALSTAAESLRQLERTASSFLRSRKAP